MVVDLAITTTALATVHYLLANLLGFAVAVTFNFAGNWLFVFKRPDGSISRQYASYVLLHGATFVVRAVVLTALIEIAGVPVVAATVVGVGVAAVANYLGTERILEDDLEWFDIVAAGNSAVHTIYNSRLRGWLQSVGLYGPLYTAYAKLLAAAHVGNTITVEAGGVEAELHAERHEEIISVMHTTAKEDEILDRFIESIDADDVVWDVGANLGVYSVLAAKVADEVVAIEPHPETADRLEDNLLDDVLTCSIGDIALSDESGTVELQLERDEIGTQTPTLDESQIQASETVTVDAMTGDELASSSWVDSPDVLKIDVEGAELSVLRGCQQLLDRVETAIVETHGNTVNRARAVLLGCGFDVEVLDRGEQEYLIGTRAGNP
jgi:FkbM family methyltransferase